VIAPVGSRASATRNDKEVNPIGCLCLLHSLTRARSAAANLAASCHEKQMASLVHWCSVVHNDRMLTSPSKPKKIRLTIPVTPEVHEAFQRIAGATSMSTGRAMGEWLGDTLDAAEYLADTLEKARAAPRQVAQQLHAYALGLTDETTSLLQKMREGRGAPSSHAQHGSAGSSDPLTPPSSNTGGKVPKNRQSSGRGKPSGGAA
jgi:hypothetical protein